MKLNGSYKFKVSSQQVFDAILNPTVLQSCIPGCNSVEFLEHNRIKANITTPLPGLKGPYGVVVRVAQAQAPNFLQLEVKERGTGGAIDASSQIHITDEPDGAVLTYDATADLDGPIKLADNPIGRGITNTTLNSFFSNLEKAIA
jgi:carbon monoxide dehydrogenase subunit G